MSKHRTIVALSFIGLVAGAVSATIWAQAVPPPSPTPAPAHAPTDVRNMKLPLELPAIGNIDAVKTWRFGRIESVVQTGGSDDVMIRIRIENGDVLETIGPRVLSDLARASNWVTAAESKEQLTRPDYVERMVAFDVDENMRIIAMISMEPMNRDRQRLRRGL